MPRKYMGEYSKRIRENFPNAFVRSPISQNEAGIKRYCFSNKEFNIIIWEAETANVIGFEIIFHDFIKEISLRWKVNEAPQIRTVCTGTRTPFKNLTPTLNGSYEMNWCDFTRAFDRGMEGADVPILLYVKNTISKLSKDAQ